MSDMLNIRPCRPEDVEKLVANAAKDNHAGVYAPQFILEKDGEIVGYLSMAVPAVLSWQDSQKMKPVDFFKEIGFIEGALANAPFIMIPCDPDSPYNRVMEKAGYVKYTKPVVLYVKVRQ